MLVSKSVRYKFEHLLALKEAFDAVVEIGAKPLARIHEKSIVLEIRNSKPIATLACEVVEKMGGKKTRLKEARDRSQLDLSSR